MIYADTDFFLALLKEGDRLHNKALEILEKYKGRITTSVITFVELGSRQEIQFRCGKSFPSSNGYL
ncbi:MAG: PIN domain-containing protein [Pyrobaculum sp.]